jgi:diacylglycerol kinase (ATP)
MTLPQPHSVTQPRSPVALIFSPHGGHVHGHDVRRLLNGAGIEVALELPIDQLDAVADAGREWQAAGAVAAVAAGGDGTVGAVATQVALSDLPLGILPLGTSNDVARALGVPLDLPRAAALVASGTPQAVESGICKPAQTQPYALSARLGVAAGTTMHTPLAERGAYFLHALTLGLNVEFARLATDVARRRRFGPLNYAAAALEAVAHMQALLVKLHLTGVVRTSVAAPQPDATGTLVVSHSALQVAVVNLPTFGGALELRLPDMHESDGLLDVVVLEAPLSIDLGGYIERWLTAHQALPDASAPDATVPSALAQDLLSLPGVQRYQARGLAIETSEPVDVTLDGELRARTPVEVHVAPRPLKVILPAKEANH